MRKKQSNLNFHGHNEQQFFMLCSRNVILKVNEEQDHLLVQYGENFGGVILTYLLGTTKDNLEMIYNNEFDFNLTEVDNFGLKTFKMKFNYYH